MNNKTAAEEVKNPQPLRLVKIGTRNYTKVLSYKKTSFGVPPTYMVVNKENEAETLAYIPFQDGPIKENGVNGVANEDLIAIVLDRLQLFQFGKYASIYNDLAIDGLTMALKALRARTDERVKRGVEGTSKK